MGALTRQHDERAQACQTPAVSSQSYVRNVASETPETAGGAGAERSSDRLAARFAGNVAGLVVAAAERGPNHPALLDPGRGVSLTWSRLHGAVDAEAARLRESGVKPG